MQVLIDPVDISAAPPEVRQWFADRWFGGLPTDPVVKVTEEVEPTKADKAKAEKAPAKEAAKPEPPKIDDVIQKAMQLLEAKGEETLSEILQKLDIRRVKECPEDKLADLLAEIAIHV